MVAIREGTDFRRSGKKPGEKRLIVARGEQMGISKEGYLSENKDFNE